MPEPIPVTRLAHFSRIPVTGPDGGADRFLVDTGIGLTIVGTSLAKRCGLELLGRDFVGQRMAGDEVRAPLARLPLLTIGGRRFEDLVVGVFDLGPSSGEIGYDGILGLDVLGTVPLTVDPAGGAIQLGAEPPAGGTRVPVRVERDGESVCLFVDVRLPDGSTVSAEVDTGSERTILDLRLLGACSVSTEGPGVRRVAEENETGAPIERFLVPVPGAVALDGAPETAQAEKTVLFQQIIHDGLLGTTFLDRYVQTYDVTAAVLTLSPYPLAAPSAD